VAKQTAETEGLQEKRVAAERQETEAIARIIRQVQDRVDALGTYENTITVLREEDAKLRSEMSEAFEQLGALSRRVQSQPPRIDQVEQEVPILRESLAESRIALENLNNSYLQLKAELDSATPRLEARLEQLQLALQDLSERRRVELDEVQVRQQEQVRLTEDVQKEVAAIQTPIARWASQMEEFSERFERNRKTLYELREVEREIRQQGKELLEMQRIAADRQRAELREWQDNQGRVDEDQNIRLDQIEARQPKTAEGLQRLDERLEQNRQSIESRIDEFWQVWSSYMQSQVEVVQKVVKQRRKG
jgi:chromosome segregation ATPase